MEIRIIITYFLISLMSSKVSTYPFTCDIYEDCAKKVYNTVPNPDDCRSFHYCLVDGTPSESQNCSEGQFYDITLSEPQCTSLEACPQICYPTPLSGDYCDTFCLEDGGIIGDPIYPYNPDDCTQYFVCNSESFGIIQCPAGEFYDGDQCIDNTSSCCPELCVPNCPKENDYQDFGLDQRVPDPFSCTGYYTCTSSGPVYSECEGPNEVFFAPSQACIEDLVGDMCYIYCPSQSNITYF